MKISYNVLIISILLICIWFSAIVIKKNVKYKKIFMMLMVSAIAFYLTHITENVMLYNVGRFSDNIIFIERAIHFVLLGQVYSFFAYVMVNIVDHVEYYNMPKRMLLFWPVIILDILILTSQFTHLIIYVQGGILYQGPLFFLTIMLRDAYGLFALVRGYMKRELLPPIFGRSIRMIFGFSVVYLLVYLFTGDDSYSYSIILFELLVLQLALLVVEFYKENITGLFNVEAFNEYIEKHLKREKCKSIYLIKLKNYDYLDDSYSSENLQLVVKNISEILKKSTMISAIFYLGNGRYAMIVGKKENFDEKAFFDNLRENISAPFDFGGAMLQLSLFVAVMNMTNGKINANNFNKYFSACDEMRYRSEDIIEVIQGDSFGIHQLQRYRDVEEAIERALVEKEFKMFYQPIVSTETGKVISAEALIRLNDRILGFISPEEFIPISETNGKILEISEFVIDSVFKFVSDHDIKAYGMKFIEMNLSVVQCMDKNLAEKLEYYLQKYNIDPTQINLEITETATNFDENSLKEQIMNIKKLGFTFSLDDYGTGYSNLVRVLEYPVDIIKLDKSLVWSAFTDNDSFITIKNLISMFHDVRRKLVAEGVESQEQMDSLTEMGCDYLQGYFYSKAVEEMEFVTFVQRFNAGVKLRGIDGGLQQ